MYQVLSLFDVDPSLSKTIIVVLDNVRVILPSCSVYLLSSVLPASSNSHLVGRTFALYCIFLLVLTLDASVLCFALRVKACSTEDCTWFFSPNNNIS